MPNRSRLNAKSLFESLVNNAVDFLEQSVADLSKRPKYSLINFCSAVELLLKARLMLEHWTLIVVKPEGASVAQFLDGDFRSVGMEEAIARLRNITEEPISREEERCFEAVRRHRNKLVHFFHLPYSTSPPDHQAIEDVVAEQCKAWFYLHRLLTERWWKYFKKYEKQIKAINKQMQASRHFLTAKYDAVLPEMKKRIELGAKYISCSSCGFSSSEVEEIAGPLYRTICKVCGAHRNVLRVVCPNCDETITVQAMGEAECPNEDFDVDLAWLLEQYGPAEDPKEDSTIAYCSLCERTDEPTAIPFDGDSEYLCLSCLETHDSADNCDWCSALNAGLNEDSYLSGCVVCGGKFSSESFQRE